MALNATIYRIEAAIADLDRGVYRTDRLTVARHPSETAERLMVRVLAWAMHADDALEFGAGLSDVDEPDLWRRDPTGTIEAWIEVGLPDERRLRRACGRAAEVTAYAYGRGAEIWWRQNATALARLERLRVALIPPAASAGLGELAARKLSVQLTGQDGNWLVTDGERAVEIVPDWRTGPRAP